jgi:hypothetical protein
MTFCLGNRRWGTQHRCWMIKPSKAVKWWWTVLLVKYKRVYKFASCPLSLEFKGNIVHLLFHYRKLPLEFRSSILSVPLTTWMSLGLCLSRFPATCLWLHCWAFPGLWSRSYSISPESVKRQKKSHGIRCEESSRDLTQLPFQSENRTTKSLSDEHVHDATDFHLHRRITSGLNENENLSSFIILECSTKIRNVLWLLSGDSKGQTLLKMILKTQVRKFEMSIILPRVTQSSRITE